MKKIINLGYGCWQKLLIKKIDHSIENQQSDIFDWMKTFSFEKMITSLENNFDILDEEDITIIKELKSYNNNKYDFYLPHEEPFPSEISSLKEKYDRRFKKFLSYQKLDGKCIIIREVNMKIGENSLKNIKISNIEKLEFPQDYSKENYDRISKFLPKNCPFILFINKKVTDEEKELVYDKFIIIDEIMDFQQAVRFKEILIQKYKVFFERISEKIDEKDIPKIYKNS